MSEDLKARIELIKQRQGAARSSTGTKALLIQTFTEDLPWLIAQAEQIAAHERAGAGLMLKLHQAEERVAELERRPVVHLGEPFTRPAFPIPAESVGDHASMGVLDANGKRHVVTVIGSEAGVKALIAMTECTAETTQEGE
jgi:hypothetical protein